MQAPALEDSDALTGYARDMRGYHDASYHDASLVRKCALLEHTLFNCKHRSHKTCSRHTQARRMNTETGGGRGTLAAAEWREDGGPFAARGKRHLRGNRDLLRRKKDLLYMADLQKLRMASSDAIITCKCTRARTHTYTLCGQAFDARPRMENVGGNQTHATFCVCLTLHATLHAFDVFLRHRIPARAPRR